ncbi:hypothetical protein [Catalinimonas niigatensis]|uniref:hypothetical protein n=1 Tax=Catalinimonas niigatensis TaxID=1397264 RepID=UPI002664F142|nr:hypothetical protein [Catalinimonas niigatensis]WPP52205.1 hypothetical protein PZB72_07410 [Catalinimonas niigatensis]
MKKLNLFMKDSYIALHNALTTPSMLTLLAKFGYNEKKIREAMDRLQQIKQIILLRNEASNVSRSATRNLQLAKDTLLSLFNIHLETARLAFKREADYHDDLNICARRKGATMDWLEQAERFYATVPQPMMEKYNVLPQELEQASQLLVQVMDLMAAQSSAKSREQELTKQRNEQVEALKIWMRQFMRVAEVALSESPQQLEALNKVVA